MGGGGISIVVPVFNEGGNVERLFLEIKAVCEDSAHPYEIIFVDDGSTDDTFARAKTLAGLKYVRMRRNFGQTAALDAGIHAAQYEYIVTMDGDLQNDPSDIPGMIKYLEESGKDVVSGWRKNRKDTFFKRFTSRGANFLRGIIVKDGIHDSGCGLKVYRRECFDGLTLYGEMHRFIPALLAIKGFAVGEVVVNHRPRIFGKTKYNWRRTFKGFVDMLGLWFWNKYSSCPLHLFGTSGIFMIFAGVLSGAVTIVKYIQRGKVGDTAWPLFTVFLFFMGLQFFTFGLLMDTESKVYRETTENKSYSIKSTEVFGDTAQNESEHGQKGMPM